MRKLSYDDLRMAVTGQAAAFRCVTEYQPAGGSGDKIFPPTYEGAKYALETRLIAGNPMPCVLLDSVQSQANRMELALLRAAREQRLHLPIIEARFEDGTLQKKFTVTSLEAPHRVADAIFRDSMIEEGGRKIMFRKSKKGGILDGTDIGNATGLFGLCPTALIFGIWDSTGPRGGLGAKIQRAVVSEMVGLNAHIGWKTSSRIDPLQISLGAGPIFERSRRDDQNPDWTIDQKAAEGKPKTGKKADRKPSEVNHGNITPQIIEGGVTIEKALQTTVISLAALRRLRFPMDGASGSENRIDAAARTVLASLSLLGAVLAREEGADLRSRCHLVPTTAFVWELIDQPGEAPKTFALDAETAASIFKKALEEAKQMKLPWEGTIEVTPHPDLIRLVARSQELAAHLVSEEGD